jgi:hypothetical protein
MYHHFIIFCSYCPPEAKGVKNARDEVNSPESISDCINELLDVRFVTIPAGS